MALDETAKADFANSSAYSLLAYEVDLIALYISDLRAAINGLGVADITDQKIAAVRADIRDVIDHTRSATDTVLGTAEDLIAAEETGEAYRALVEDRMMRLMEACSFQDLTGQRLSRVAEALNAMDQRLKNFAEIVKPRAGHVCRAAEEETREEWRQRHLISGPGGAGAIDQDTVDGLMAMSA